MNMTDYRLIPKTFVHCSNGGCTRAADCLRQMAFRSVNDINRMAIYVLNPLLACGDECGEYLPAKPQPYKRGMSRLYDNMTVTTARSVRRTLHMHFGNAQYYRIVNGLRPISPDEQLYIGRVLREHGVGDSDIYDAEELRLTT